MKRPSHDDHCGGTCISCKIASCLDYNNIKLGRYCDYHKNKYLEQLFPYMFFFIILKDIHNF
jgi:hypothetical protein